MAILTPVSMVRNSAANSTGFATIATSSALTAQTIQQDIDDKIGFLVEAINAGTTDSTILRISKGGDRRAWRNDIGDVDVHLSATSTATIYKFIGPFESARFNIVSTSTDNAPLGRGYLKITPFKGTTAAATATGNLVAGGSVKIVSFKMPSVEYTT